jgi:hypothetical protein
VVKISWSLDVVCSSFLFTLLEYLINALILAMIKLSMKIIFSMKVVNTRVVCDFGYHLC